MRLTGVEYKRLVDKLIGITNEVYFLNQHAILMPEDATIAAIMELENEVEEPCIIDLSELKRFKSLKRQLFIDFEFTKKGLVKLRTSEDRGRRLKITLPLLEIRETQDPEKIKSAMGEVKASCYIERKLFEEIIKDACAWTETDSVRLVLDEYSLVVKAEASGGKAYEAYIEEIEEAQGKANMKVKVDLLERFKLWGDRVKLLFGNVFGVELDAGKVLILIAPIVDEEGGENEE